MAINFQGISSGLPTEQLIQAMIAQESAPIDRLIARQTANTQKKTTLTSIKSALASLATAISSLNSSTLNKRTVTSTDSSAVSATASGAMSGSYDIQVGQLATKARLEVSKSFASPTESVLNAGETYTIVNKDGGQTSITLGDGKTSLADLSDAINASDSGVTASVVQKKPGEYQLVLSSKETGEGTAGGRVGIFGGSGNALGVGEDDTEAFTQGVAVTATAQNAKFTLNGVEMERTSNTISDAVDGVTFTLNKADSSKTVSLNVDLDMDAVTKAFQDVIAKYNSAYQIYKNASGKGGNLSGDLSIQTIFSQLRSAMTGLVEGSGGSTGSMGVLGMTTGREGTLTLDTKRLEEALRQNPDMVSKVFEKASSDTKGLIDKLTTYGGGTLTTVINGIDNTNSLLAKQIDNLQAKIDRRKEMLTAQFARMEGLIGQMQSAGQSLSGLA